MRKKSAAVVSLVLAGVLALSACSSSPTGNDNKSTNSASGNEDDGNSSSTGQVKISDISDLVTYEVASTEMENYFILGTAKAADLNVLCNLTSSLLDTDNKGQLVAGVAETWGSEDGGLTWTFNLRDNVNWVDVNANIKAPCTAQDWLTGLEWVMNYWKNGPTNISMPSSLIEGAEDYYNYTKELTKEEALALDASEGSVFLDMVGIEAPDDYTLIYHCLYEAPYFDTLTVSACLYPLSQAYIDEIGVENVTSADNNKMWYTGPYTLTNCILGSEKTLTRNPEYWDTDCTLFETVTIKIVDDTLIAYQLYQNGEIDHVSLSESVLRQIYDDESNSYHDQLVEKLPTKFSYQMHINYDKKKEDGSDDTNWNLAIANENFRLSLYYGLDLTNFFKRTNFINPYNCENNAYTAPGLVYLSDGKEYTSVVREKLGIGESDGTAPARLDSDKAEEYKQKAIEELTALGVTFPIEFDYYISSSSSTAKDSAEVLQQAFADSLGEDYVHLNIKTFVNSLSQEILPARLQSFVISGWGADYGDVQNFLGQETYGEDSAYYSNNYSNINDATDENLIATYQEFTDLVNEANAITDDMDARYEAYAEAEAYMIQHALTIPCYYDISWELTHINDYSKINAAFGIQNYLYKNWETSVDAYTTEQYEQIKADYNN